jgi:hypothetical protein
MLASHRARRTLGVLALSTLLLGACDHPLGLEGDGVAKTESRDVAAFDSIELSGVVQLEIVTGPLEKLSITGDDNLLPLLSTTVAGTKLTIKSTEAIHPKTPLVVTVHAPAVRAVDAAGVTTVHAAGIAVPTFALAMSGASKAELSGQVTSFQVTLSGAVHVRAKDLVAKDARVELSGAGNVELDATETLRATVSGAGAVRYRGSPKVEKSISGVGSVDPLP